MSLDERKKEIQHKKDELYKLIEDFINDINLLEDEVYNKRGNNQKVIALLEPKKRRELRDKTEFLELVFNKSIFQEKILVTKKSLELLDETYSKVSILELERESKEVVIRPIYVNKNDAQLFGSIENLTIIENSQNVVTGSVSANKDVHFGNNRNQQTFFLMLSQFRGFMQKNESEITIFWKAYFVIPLKERIEYSLKHYFFSKKDENFTPIILRFLKHLETLFTIADGNRTHFDLIIFETETSCLTIYYYATKDKNTIDLIEKFGYLDIIKKFEATK